MKAIVGQAASDPAAAIERLRDLVAQVEAAQSVAVARWHQQQSIALLAQLEHERGSAVLAAELYEQAGHEALADYRGAKLAAAWRFAKAALLRFEAGERAKGLELATEALSLAELHLDPSVTYERLVAEVRRAREAEAGGA